ncbi:MAG: hypothetical protein DRO36_01965 [Candidatus Hecatellales archaeon]|nr:MAG: hypothetical protein DRO36_01965 [Candidatus Hecatellales archaeon]
MFYVFRLMRRGKAVTIWLPMDLLKAIDEVRGNISRSSFIVWLVEDAIKSYKPEPKKTVLRFVKQGTYRQKNG